MLEATLRDVCNVDHCSVSFLAVSARTEWDMFQGVLFL